MDEYIFDGHDDDRELARLRLIERALDDSSRRWLDRTGLTAGWRCLDVGCGAGSVLRWLGERVGPEGRAVGVDTNTVYLRDLDAAPYEIVTGDIFDATLAVDFDLVHARYVLIHNRDPAALLRRLAGLLAPGGYLVLAEPDFESAQWLDEHYRAACERVHRAIASLFRGRGLDPGFGKRLPLAVADQKLHIEHIEAHAHLERGGGAIAQVMGASAAALRESYLATGEASSADIDAYARGSADPAAWAIYYTTVAVIARRPES